jgi:hypothetical protein
MVDVPHWDFHWQDLYFYDEPIEVHAGDTMKLTCSYDTVGQTQTTTFGEGTTDEMCIAFLYQTVGTADGPPPCVHCADVLNGADPSTLCGASQPVFDALAECVCTTHCVASCSDNACSGGTASSPCVDCISSSCSFEFSVCGGDS